MSIEEYDLPSADRSRPLAAESPFIELIEEAGARLRSIEPAKAPG